MNLAMCLENSAARNANKVSLQFEGRSYTFRELNRLTNRIAKGHSAIRLPEGADDANVRKMLLNDFS